jgi:predicted dehydrogenase
MEKALIVGMGFGRAVYKPVLEELGYQVITVDLVQPADFKTVQEAIDAHTYFKTVNICTPNFTHESIAREVADHSGIVFVEKPGVKDRATWQRLVDDFPATKFMMVKNNQYRADINLFKQLADQSDTVNIIWNNKNRIPNPGSWFTDKSKAFGGVSRDLIPHMLSYYCTLTDYRNGNKRYDFRDQQHSLSTITSTDYGTINKNGVYDVDDVCEISYTCNNTTWKISANWKNDISDDVYISFGMKNSAVKHVLGLCPEVAYKSMIRTAVENRFNNDFWTEQLAQDLWIHEQIEQI